MATHAVTRASPIDQRIVAIVNGFRKEAEDARRTWDRKSRMNIDMYHGRQSWSHKTRGQSREFIPKVPMAVEQISGFVKTGLVEFGDWFIVDMPDDDLFKFLDASATQKYLLDELYQLDFVTLIGDAVKQALLSSKLIVKIYGITEKKPTFRVESSLRVVNGQPQETQKVVRDTVSTFKLAIELVRPQDFYIDPTGRGLYVIHRVERDLHEVMEMAERGVYDKGVVELLMHQDYTKPEDQASKARATGLRLDTKSTRKRVMIDEFWGTLLNEEGLAEEGMENIVLAVANEHHLIRAPEKNPFWHGKPPFVDTELIRVPHSVMGKSLMDHVSPLNRAYNELINLSIDGAIKSVWGVSQLKRGYMENPGQVSGGISPGMALIVKTNMPIGDKVYEKVDTGHIPKEAMAMLNLLDKEIQAADLVSEIKLGLLPQRQVKVGEIQELVAQSTAFFNAIIRDLEDKFIEPILDMSWKTLWQFMDDVYEPEIVAAIGKEAALVLGQMSPEERFVAVSTAPKFRVRGIRAILKKKKDYDKLTELMSLIASSERFMSSL